VAKSYIKNPFLMLDGHDFSSLVKGVTVNQSKAELPVTASGDGGEKSIHGLAKDSFTLDLYQDADLSILDRVLFEHLDDEEAFVVEVAKAGSTISSSNPSWTGNCKVFNYTPLSGDVGTVHMASGVVLSVQGAITRSGT
jgi:hypothetical protein